jgi:hypothetical protein
MSTRIKYTDEPIGPIRVIPDFLPPPEELVFREEAVKVTIALSKRSIEFFKAEARRHNIQYQKMIRRLLDRYAERYATALDAPSPRGVNRPPARRTRPRAAVRVLICNNAACRKRSLAMSGTWKASERGPYASCVDILEGMGLAYGLYLLIHVGHLR